jgi:NAD(P)-dependent dehydrogenase (short-subunit alcohol dehydrogenase family)
MGMGNQPAWDGGSDPRGLFDVSGRSVVVVGATGAFGAMAARVLGAAGARLTLTGGGAEKLHEVAEEIRSRFGAEVAEVARRPEEEEDAEAIVATALERYGRVDGLLVASGTNRVHPIVDYPVSEWDEVMRANVRGPWLMCRAVGREMIRQGDGGKVVIVSSTRGLLGHPAGYTAYSPSKAAANLLVKTLACEWGKYGIHVNAIAPTVFRSDLTAWMYAEEGAGKATREDMLRRIPIGRLAEPEDFAGAVLFFLSPASDFCTGQVLYVDGGYTAG